MSDIICLIGPKDMASLAIGSQALLSTVLEHTPAITLRIDGTSSQSPWGPLAGRSRLPHAVQAAQRKSQSTLRLCLRIHGKSTCDQAVAAALRKLGERATEGGQRWKSCTSVCALEIKVAHYHSCFTIE
jgi:hypothetical protein